jgi:uncharacterized repeat protein (TIGR01451 family)
MLVDVWRPDHQRDCRRHRSISRLGAAVLVIAAGCVLPAVVAAGPAVAASRAADAHTTAHATAHAAVAAGVPQPPLTLFTEGFENGVTATPELLTDYTGAAPTGETYSADPAWLANCNGIILEFDSPDADYPNAPVSPGCQYEEAYDKIRQLAYALGAFTGDSTPGTNHVVSAYTQANPGAGLRELEMNHPVTLPGSSRRFIDFSVDAAAVNCPPVAAAPAYQFSLISGGVTTPLGGTVDACTSTTTEPAPAVGTTPAEPINVGSYASGASALLTGGSTLSVELLNEQASGVGNDAAFDNVKVLDVTPRLDESFTPTAIQPGQTSVLTFTVTNTSELASKSGWSFTDSLPPGLTVAPGTPLGGTCAATTAAPAGGTSVSVTAGDLPAGAASCTITIPVTATKTGTYTAVGSTVVPVGLDPPGSASLTVSSPSYTVTKVALTPSTQAGKTVRYEISVRNTGSWPYTAASPASFTDNLSGVLGLARYDGDAVASSGPSPSYADPLLSWSGPLAVGATVEVTYSVTVGSGAVHGGTLHNSVTTPAGGGGDCPAAAPAPACSTTTGVAALVSTSPPTTPPAPATLPSTGADVGQQAGAGALFIAVGAGLLLLERRMRRARPSTAPPGHPPDQPPGQSSGPSGPSGHPPGHPPGHPRRRPWPPGPQPGVARAAPGTRIPRGQPGWPRGRGGQAWSRWGQREHSPPTLARARRAFRFAVLGGT